MSDCRSGCACYRCMGQTEAERVARLGGEQSPDAHDLEVEALRAELSRANNAIAGLKAQVGAGPHQAQSRRQLRAQLDAMAAERDALKAELATIDAHNGEVRALVRELDDARGERDHFRQEMGRLWAIGVDLEARAATWKKLSEDMADTLVRFLDQHGKPDLIASLGRGLPDVYEDAERALAAGLSPDVWPLVVTATASDEEYDAMSPAEMHRFHLAATYLGQLVSRGRYGPSMKWDSALRGPNVDGDAEEGP